MQDAGLTAPASVAANLADLRALLEAGQHYALLNRALEQLRTDPADVKTAFLAFQAYRGLGLAGPARELLLRDDGPLAGWPQRAGLLEQLARCPSGRVSWRALALRFEKNAARVYERFPRLRVFEREFHDIPRSLELYRTSDGNWQVRTRATDDLPRWLPDLCDVRGAAARVDLRRDQGRLFCAPYLLLDDRCARLFERVFEATARMFLTFSPRIYLLEPDPLRFGLTLYVLDSVERLCHERVSLFVGPDCFTALARFLRDQPTAALPDLIVRLPSPQPTDCGPLVEALRRVAADREARAIATIARVQHHYDPLPADHWARRFAECASATATGRNPQPLRVLGLTSRFTTVLQYAMRDLKAAFEKRGCEFHLLIENNDHDLFAPVWLARVIDEFRPDLIVVIDHLRREYSQVVPANVPFVCWVQDMLPNLCVREAGRSHGPLDFFVAPELHALVKHFDYPAAQGLRWTMATNDELYSDQPLADSELAPHRCDFSFASNQSAPPQDFHAARRAMFADHPAACRIVDHVFEALKRELVDDPRAGCTRSASIVLREAEQATGASLAQPGMAQSLCLHYIQPMAELMFRQSTLAGVAEYCERTGRKLHLYGTGWESHPRFARYARGVARNGRELRAVYQASAINLQIIGTGAIHPRLLDGLAAGGFFLIRYSPYDAIHAPAQQLLAAVEKFGLRPDTPYPPGPIPELTAAARCLAALNGQRGAPGEVVVTSGDLETCREHAAAGYRRVAGAVFADYADVSFASQEEFAALAERYLRDPARRASVARSMRCAVLTSFTYTSLVDALLRFLSERPGQASPRRMLKNCSAGPPSPAPKRRRRSNGRRTRRPDATDHVL